MKKPMKILLLLVLLMLGLATPPAKADGATTNLIALTWDILPAYTTQDVFYVYSTTNVTIAVTNWPAYTNVTYQQFIASGTNVLIPVATEQQRQFTFISSNVFGRSDFADPVSSWRTLAGSGLRIVKR